MRQYECKIQDVCWEGKAEVVFEGSTAGVMIAEIIVGEVVKRLEGKSKGHVYETVMWHFKLSAEEVKIRACTHTHTISSLHYLTLWCVFCTARARAHTNLNRCALTVLFCSITCL